MTIVERIAAQRVLLPVSNKAGPACSKTQINERDRLSGSATKFGQTLSFTILCTGRLAV